MKMRIRNKMLVTICSVILFSLAGQILFNQFLSKSFFMRQQKSIIAKAFKQIKAGYDGDLDDVSAIAEELMGTYSIKTVIFQNDEMVYSSMYFPTRREPRFDASKILRDTEFTENPTIKLTTDKNVFDDAKRLRLAGKFDYEGEEVKVLLSLRVAAIDKSISIFTESNIYISMAMLLVSVLIAFIVSKTISAPITEIEAVSKKIAKGDFSDSADENVSTVELASLARSVNQMSRQLEQDMRELAAANEQLQKDIEHKKQIEGNRREFIANISHEMKTPLALLQIYAENLKNNLEGIDRNYYFDTILEETEKLNKMISDMLEVSSIDCGFVRLNFEEVDLAGLCRDIVREYRPLLESYQTSVDLTEKAIVSGDVKYLEQVIKNILNNAVQHTKNGNDIRVALRRMDGKVSLEVFNQGEHIPESDLEYVWDAFYRTDKARTRDGKNNVGLGLYIVKTVIGKHDGACSIRNTENGVIVAITLDCK